MNERRGDDVGVHRGPVGAAGGPQQLRRGPKHELGETRPQFGLFDTHGSQSVERQGQDATLARGDRGHPIATEVETGPADRHPGGVVGRDRLRQVIVDHEVPVASGAVDEEMDVVGERKTLDQHIALLEGGDGGDSFEVVAPPVDLRWFGAVCTQSLDECGHHVGHALRHCHNHRPPDHPSSRLR